MIMQKNIEVTGHIIAAEVGLVLVDLSLELVALDQGAAAILNYSSRPGLKRDPGSVVPKEVLDVLRSRQPTDLSSVRAYFRMGVCEYTCRAYLVESYDVSIEPLVALHLEKVATATDAIHEIGVKYNLTEREQEALRGISMGLTSKEVAERMNISPNTVKAFLRLIMIKMGVSTRGGIVANILNRASLEGHPLRPELGGSQSGNAERTKATSWLPSRQRVS